MAQAKNPINPNSTDLLQLSLTSLKHHGEAISKLNFQGTPLHQPLTHFSRLIRLRADDVITVSDLTAEIEYYNSALGKLADPKLDEEKEKKKSLEEIDNETNSNK